MRREGQFNYYTFIPDTLSAYCQALEHAFLGSPTVN
jgi:hypothetical protein